MTFTHNKVSNVSTYIVYEINLGSYTQGDDVALANYLLGVVELIKNADSGWSAFYSEYCFGFYSLGTYLLSNGKEFG